MMIAGSSYIPKDNPAKPRGEDAHFFCLKAQVIGVADGVGGWAKHAHFFCLKAQVIGVAGGVGGWAKHGIDAGEYARELMRNAASFIKNSLPAAADPKSALIRRFVKTAKPGSSTACIISLDGNCLRAVNIGDSGFVVIRDGETIYRSPVQQSRFNYPFQLGLKSEHGPEAAENITVEVEMGDVVVAGTDGLFDNMFPDEVAATVEQCFNKGMSPTMVAHELAMAARRKSLDRKTVTPFSVASEKAGVVRLGGKKDDITVVAHVVPFDDKFALD